MYRTQHNDGADGDREVEKRRRGIRRGRSKKNERRREVGN